ncbi:uncharacterized protein LOC34618502 [Cyclospora cayetanensis]|uniref:Uncharacterized protein LOC34618502 n=1 Tax=Cyclospora cayetanensis TaxID=88456 RepID=A0A6P6RZJ4_9EIME|nr:uncharacterized protein LOC34618502 [Cyclospora cayetanensis]
MEAAFLAHRRGAARVTGLRCECETFAAALPARPPPCALWLGNETPNWQRQREQQLLQRQWHQQTSDGAPVCSSGPSSHSQEHHHPYQEQGTGTQNASSPQSQHLQSRAAGAQHLMLPPSVPCRPSQPIRHLQEDSLDVLGPQEGHPVAAAPPLSKSKRVWGLSRTTRKAAAAAVSSQPSAGCNWHPPASLGGASPGKLENGAHGSDKNDSNCKKEEPLSFRGIKATTAAAAVAAAVVQAAAQHQPSVMLQQAAEEHLPGPAGRWLRRRQQQEKGKRMKGQGGDSPFACRQQNRIRSADSSQSSVAAAATAAVAAATAAPNFTPTPGCWGSAWLGLSHCEAAAAAEEARRAAESGSMQSDQALETKAPLQASASWARALLFLGFPFDAFHLGLIATPSPCPPIMSFLVESNVAAVLRSSDIPVKKDPTGEVMCSVHSSVSESLHMCPGSTVILQEVTVYYAAFKLPYVLITQRSLVRAFPPSFLDDTLRQQAEDARGEWESRWRGVHGEAAGMPGGQRS